jgi:hypothetical protein
MPVGVLVVTHNLEDREMSKTHASNGDREPLCGAANPHTAYITDQDEAVTCKRCLRLMGIEESDPLDDLDVDLLPGAAPYHYTIGPEMPGKPRCPWCGSPAKTNEALVPDCAWCINSNCREYDRVVIWPAGLERPEVRYHG